MTNPFDRWRARGFGPDLLPVIPPLAALTATTTIDPKARGKAIGIRSPGGWHGLRDWHGRAATPEDHAAWGAMGAGVGLQCGRWVAVDLDVMHELCCGALRQLAATMLPGGVPRVGRAPKVILLFAAAPGEHFVKQRTEFRLPGSDVVHAIEVLGEGQHFVVEGTHPGEGVGPYRWPEGEPLMIDLATVTVAQVKAYTDAALDVIAELGGEIVARSAGSHSGERNDVDQAALAAPSEELLAEALAVLPNNGDRDGWIRMGIALKAAGGMLEQWAEWSEQWGPEDPDDLRTRWEGFRPPFAVGWPHLERAARAAGWYRGVEAEFTAAGVDLAALSAEAALAGTGVGAEAEPVTLQDAMFARYVWVEAVERIGDTLEKILLSRGQFNARLPDIGPPHDSRRCAWATFQADGDRRRAVKDVTYRPGGLPIVDEPGKGPCFNTWRASSLRARVEATDADVRLWLDLAERLFPDPAVRAVVLDWLAALLQRPGVKPAFVLVMGGHEGIGKDSLLAPIVLALGQHNVANVTMKALLGTQTYWLADKQLVLITEMHSFSRREVMEMLKPIGAAPPDMLEVNKKYLPQYNVPNIVAGLYFTNHIDALALSDSDRRHFIAWSPHDNPETYAKPRKDAFEEWFVGAFYPWLRNGGAEAVAGWLLKRDIRAFLKLARAPHTAAKDTMRREGRSEAVAALEDALEAMDLPDLVNPEDLAVRVGLLGGRGGKQPTGHAVAKILRARGGELMEKESIAVPSTALVTGAKRIRIWAIRNIADYAGMRPAVLARRYAEMWGATKQDLEGFFAAGFSSVPHGNSPHEPRSGESEKL